MNTYQDDALLQGEERRHNGETSAHVESALTIQRHGDEWGARDYLVGMGVAPHIILRVLSCKAFHRKRER